MESHKQIKRITDQDLESSVLDLRGTNVSTNLITCPAQPAKTLGIKLAAVVFIVKNLKIRDLPECNESHVFYLLDAYALVKGWNQIQFHLSDSTRRAYRSNYIETMRVQIHANCRTRRAYFSGRLYAEQDLPPEFKLFRPCHRPPLRQLPTNSTNCASTR
ncbi:hypothetical protein PsorP6_001636 [Peronosclerospora sorghi]|uniref:Uncharacterized protein n=1 Tax=Peronosclerospora sorghi TaxID=230839 RepID=A0ACC0WPK9_9STRA|nr:hypothetical protein PsorP6_001636 [Peronosclerospora sorghi]